MNPLIDFPQELRRGYPRVEATTVPPEKRGDSYPRVVRTHRHSYYLEIRYTEVAPGVVVRGIFAVKPVPADHLLEEVPVIPIPVTEPMTDLEDRYAWTWELTDDSGNLVTRTAHVLGVLPVLNHSTEPNVIMRAPEAELFYMQMWSKTAIAAGDELTHNYGWPKNSKKWNQVDRYLRPVPRRKTKSALDYKGA